MEKLKLENVSKIFSGGNRLVEAVKNVSLEIESGDIFGIIGLSGAGKSTLVRCMNLLEIPTSGRILFNGIELNKLKKKEVLRERKKISMIFQNFNLFSQRNVLDNVCYPMIISGFDRTKRVDKAKELLELVGLSDKYYSFPEQLSGGQKQRVAIARALATNPEVLLCDEATSALDPNTTDTILKLLKKINKELGVTIIVITHEMRVVQQICNKVAVMSGGNVVEVGEVEEVFMSPKSEIAKELVLPKLNNVDVPEGKIIRVVFEGQTTTRPLMAEVIIKCRAVISILGADTKDIDGKTFGQMIVQLPKDKNSVVRIEEYLTKQGLHFEEVE